MLVGGLLAFALLYLVSTYGTFGSGELFNLWRGKITAETRNGVLEAFSLPLVFVCIFIALREGYCSCIQPAGAGRQAAGAAGLSQGIRAAIGAVLIHQLVDFDLSVPALAGALFLLGGMLFAASTASEPCATGSHAVGCQCKGCLQAHGQQYSMAASGTNSGTLLERLSRLLLPALALALPPFAVWIPLTSGYARSNAEIAEDEAGEALHAPPGKAYSRLSHESVAWRGRARDAASFDGAAWSELALACERLPEAASAAVQARIMECLRAAEVRRPLSAVPKVLLGNFYMRAKMTGHFEVAERAYAAAAARYPLAPGIKLWEGDALLLRDQPAAAAIKYAEAFATDMRIADANVRLGAVFTDPRPGAASQHGCEIQVFTKASRELSNAAATFSPEKRQGLLLRRLVALAGFLHEAKRLGSGAPENAAARLSAALLATAEALAALPAALPERAHAALMLALAHLEVGAEKNQQPFKEAWAEARRLQQESLGTNRPGTPPSFFQTVERWLQWLK